MPTINRTPDPTASLRDPLCRACRIAAVALLVCAVGGCVDEAPKAKTKQTGGPAKIKTTDDIGEFQAADGKAVVDSKVRITNPVTGALEAYEPLKQQISEIAITQAVQLFQATEGRYPKDHDEFMTRVIKQNNIRLPVLSAGKHYEYDVQNHCLMVVTEPQK